MNSIHNKISVFEELPEPVIGTILDQLNKITGSKGIINTADIPVIKRYANSLACTSKTMAAKVTHPEATYLFLESLSAKYGKPCEEFAVILNTVGCRRWLWNYIKVNGDDKAYQVIQDIYELASDALNEARNAGLNFNYTEGCIKWPSPNPFYHQTKQGFVLNIDGAPNFVSTPFGEIIIYGGIDSGFASFYLAEIFIKQLNAVFHNLRLGGGEDNKGENYELAVSLEKDKDTLRKNYQKEMKIITEEELACRKGTQNLIVNSLHGNSASYIIREVKGKKVPDVIWREAGSRRSYELINRIWEMLEAKRKGGDPIAIKINHNGVIKLSKDCNKPIFNNISEVSAWAIELVEKLERQPFFKGEIWLDLPIKLLALNDGNERLIEILNNAVETLLDKGTNRYIHTFGYNRNDDRYLYELNLGCGIEMRIFDDHKTCDLNTLKKAYDQVLENIGHNWMRAAVKDYPDVLHIHTESEEDYVLFIKENWVRRADMLITCLAGPLGLSETIHCHADMNKPLGSIIYLWIKKDCLDKVMAALNITL